MDIDLDYAVDASLPSSPPDIDRLEPELPATTTHIEQGDNTNLPARFPADAEPSEDPIALGTQEDTVSNATHASGRIGINNTTISRTREGPVRKRGPPSPDGTPRHRAFEGTFIAPTQLTGLFGVAQAPKNGPSSTNTANTVMDCLFQARDLILKASLLTKNDTDKTKLLDLLNVFREFTETGTIRSTAAILASQIQNLERTTRQIDEKAKALKAPNQPKTNQAPQKGPDSNSTPSAATTAILAQNPANSAPNPAPSSYAKAATRGPATSEWTVVGQTKKTPNPRAKAAEKAKDKTRVILVQENELPYSPIQVRNAINEAFNKAGVNEPVVRTVERSRARNIAVSATSAFSADYLIEKQDIWKRIIPHKTLHKESTWYKVVIHGVPLTDFDSPDGLKGDLVKQEIKTFNKGLNPLGNPYWLTSYEKRHSGTIRAGSIVVAFNIESEANRAIRNRLYIAGESLRVEKLLSVAPTSQCGKCQGYGHLSTKCTRQLACSLCAASHHTRDHVCSQCKKKGVRCAHLTPKCTNCKGSHTATDSNCEIRQALFRTSL